MNNNTVSAVQLLWETTGVEAMLLVSFVLGYLVFNSAAVQKRLLSDAHKLAEKHLAAHVASGMYEAALAMTAETVDMVAMQVQALVESKRGKVAAHLDSCARVPGLLTSAALQQVSADLPEQATADVKAWFAKKGVADDSRETLVVSYMATDWKAAVELAQEEGMPARARVRVAKEALRRSDLPAALAVMQAAVVAGLFVPAHILGEYVSQGLRARGESAVMADLESLNLPAAAVADLVGALTKAGDAQQVEMVLKLAEKAGGCYAALEAVFKTLAKTSDQRAFEYFDRLLAEGPLQEGTAVAVLGFCADGHNVPLAEKVFATAREQACATVVVYSALMRVYAVCRLFHKSCDLYSTLESDGLEPDTVMYGGLIKAAVECGRLDLSRKLLRASGTMDIQNYMSLFRACGRERNSRKAVELLGELETSNVGADTTAYNCVLDVCIKCSDKKAVADLFTKMKVTGYVDTISYNTLLKGMGPGATGLTDANMVLAEMRSLNLKPNQITYNSLINYAISRGDVKSAWGFVESMEQENVQVDHFTCSIMMKGLRTASQPADVDRTIALIDRSAVTPDEVLVNTLLDACIRLRDVQRLTGALSTFRKGGVVPSDHAYGSVFKAYGHARALDDAWACWNDMLARQVSPSDSTVQAMVDALVQCGSGSDAKKVLDQAAKMGSKPTSYVTLLKTLVQKRDLPAVMDLYDTMPASSLTLSVYNMVIEACARQGDAEKGAGVFRAMMAAGVTPDVTTYSAVIKAYVLQGDLEQAVQLFTLMRKRDVQPDVGLFNTMLDGLARKQMSALVGHVLQDMESSSVAPTTATLAILVKMYGRAHDLDSAFAYVDSWKVKYDLEANAQVLVALVTACANAGDMARAQGVFGELRAPDAKAYTAMVQGHLKAQSVKDALRLLECAVDQKIVLEQELLDNAIFMAGRRNISSDNLAKKLTAKGYKFERASPEQTITRRKQGKWREGVAA